MKFSESWLRSFVNPDLTTEALSNLLTMSGLEVEELNKAAPEFSGVVVAKIIAIQKHPDADRLNVCQVDVGNNEVLTIVCGAPNVAIGLHVPCAKVGANLPGGMLIKQAKMRGVESFGMLCSSKELGINDESAGLMVLPEDALIGANVRDILMLDDSIFTIKLTPNRADCLSVIGVAREVSALTNQPLIEPASKSITANIDDQIKVNILATDLCGRFTSRVIKNINANVKTPNWLLQRLQRSDIRSVNILVDISNYLMLEYGLPTHIYDLDKLSGDLAIQWAEEGSQLRLLNDIDLKLNSNYGVIVDQSGPICLGGIMGGASTGVSLSTRNIFIECAFWWPDSIRGRSRSLGFGSDASHRFERGVDYSQTLKQIERLCALINDLCNQDNQADFGPIVDQNVNTPTVKPVQMRIERAKRILGIDLLDDEVKTIFSGLSFNYEYKDGVFTVTAPAYRFDIQIEEDLIEEVARVYGYDRIPAKVPVAAQPFLSMKETQISLDRIRSILVDAEYHEVINYSFIDDESESLFSRTPSSIKLLNPIASNLSVMRSTLIGSLIANLQFNLNHKADRIRIFEIARVYLKNSQICDGKFEIQGFDQPYRLAGLAYGTVLSEQWGEKKRVVDFYDVKNDIEKLTQGLNVRYTQVTHPAMHPGRSAKIELNGLEIGFIGELHPKLSKKFEFPYSPILFEINLDKIREATLASYEEVSKYPVVTRDFAVLAQKHITASDILDLVNDLRLSSNECACIRECKIFDVYKLPDNQSADFNKSLAFRVTLQDIAGTMDEKQVSIAINTLISGLEGKLGVKLRT